uniref:Restriction endonuclease type IV Mrr domain-containing protein n=1 Tax=viral metagenome TaxID=1070528 RepID=A0A6C0EKJ1_9ZZZZ
MSLKINYTINPWLENTDLESNTEHLNKLLNLGKQISNLADISINPVSSLLKPINDQVEGLTTNLNGTYKEIYNIFELNKLGTETIHTKVDQMNRSIDESISKHYDQSKEQYQQLNAVINKLTGDINNSSIKGTIGENFLETVLKNGFPDDTVEVTAQTGHEADLHLISTKLPKILIESKLYKHSIPSAEIEKFYNDLKTTGIKYGIFVSLTSNISGHRRLEYKYIHDRHVIFIPNAGFENMTIIYAVLFLRELETMQNKNISNETIDEKCRIIYSSLTDLDKIFEYISKIKNDTLKSKTIIDTQINGLISNCIQSEIIVKNIVSKMKKNITESLSELDCTYKIIEEDHLDTIIKDFINSDNKLYIALAESFTLFKNLNYKIHKDETTSKYNIYNDTELVCELKIAKSKATYDFASGIKYDVKGPLDLVQFKKIIEI